MHYGLSPGDKPNAMTSSVCLFMGGEGGRGKCRDGLKEEGGLGSIRGEWGVEKDRERE